MKVSFDSVNAVASQMRTHFQEQSMTDPTFSSANHYRSEYCYQLVSFLMETQKLLNGEFFAPDYIEEKTYTLSRLANEIRRLDVANANRT